MVGVLVTGAILGAAVGFGVMTAVGCTEIDGAAVTGGPTGAGVLGLLVTSMGAKVGPGLEDEGFKVPSEGCCCISSTEFSSDISQNNNNNEFEVNDKRNGTNLNKKKASSTHR